MKYFLPQFLTVFVIIIMLFSCTSETEHVQYKTIPKAVWNKDSVMTFQFLITDTLNFHNLYVNVRNDINYKYSNLWLFIKIIQPDETLPVTDTFEVTLADPTGKWLGKGFGGVKTSEIPYRQNVYFPVAGQYKIQIQQGMRGKPLEGITEIGFSIEKK